MVGPKILYKVAALALLGVVVSGCNVFDVSQDKSSSASSNDSTSPSNVGESPEGVVVEEVTDIPDNVTVGNISNANSPLGTNLAAPADWSPSLPFTNIMRSARSFASSNGAGSASFDENGWIKSTNGSSLFAPLIWDMEQGAFPTGDYVVLYDGTADISYTGAEVIDKAPGREVVRVSSAGQFGMTVNSTDYNNYFKNARVIMPGGVCRSAPLDKVSSSNDCPQSDYMSFEDNYDGQLLYNPEFLKSLQPYSALRFMDFLDTNESDISSWSDRNTMDSQTWGYGNGGVAWEAIINLCNTMKTDCWINVPTKANDSYVWNLASLVKDKLDPELTAIVEYSNEVWNYGFEQTEYAKQKGLQRGYGWVKWCDTCATEQVDHMAVLHYYGVRSVEIFKIFDQVITDSSRLNKVIAVQSATQPMTEQMLGFQDIHASVDSVAIAPYIGGSYGTGSDLNVDGGNVSVDQLFDHMETVGLDKIREDITLNSEVAGKYNLSLIAYEGGQHLVGVGSRVDNANHNALYDAANRHYRMKALYKDYFQAWKEATSGNTQPELFVHFTHVASFSKWGRWGIKETYNQPTSQAPKFAGTMEFISENPRWWTE